MSLCGLKQSLSVENCAAREKGIKAPPLGATVHLCAGITVTPERSRRLDVTQALVRCTVSNAPTSDTNFTLHYALVDDAGNARPPFDATCDGALPQGSGTCQQTYSVLAPRSPTDSTVSGESLPSHTTLGSVTPAGTPS